MTLANWLRELYSNLMKNDWKMNDIDDMDLIGYLDIRSYEANKDIEVQLSALDAAGF